MKKIIFSLLLSLLAGSIFSQVAKVITLNKPDTSRGLPVMKALASRASASEWDTTSLNLQDLSDLLWAANGVNRPALGKRTAPSARNSKDIDVYVFMKSGAYLYDADKHLLNLVSAGDNRLLCAGQQTFNNVPPVFCLLVSDVSRFTTGTDSMKLVLAAEDAGIVSQNISVFCAGVGLSTRPRATMDQAKLRALLNLKKTQYLLLNNPVSYKKD